MDVLDFFYEEFVTFCNELGLVEQFNKGLRIKGYRYELSCKPFILSRITPDIFNCSLRWIDTPSPKDLSWKEVHELWSSREESLKEKLKKKAHTLDPITLYYSDSEYDYEEYLHGSIRELLWQGQLVPIRTFDTMGFRKPPKKGARVISSVSSWILTSITECDVPIKFEEYDLDRNIIKMSDKFTSVMKEFPAGLDAILELNPSPKLNFIDIDFNTGKVSYLPIEKIEQCSNPWESSNRRTTTIGRLLNKFNWKPYLDRCDIERISNFVSGWGEELNVEIWDSERIREGYLEDNYAEELDCISSTLHHSCMRFPECQDFFEFYERAHTKIVVALDEKKKICARALLWKINDSLYFLDRIYSISPFYNVKFAKIIAKQFPIDFYKVGKTIYDMKTYSESPIPSYRIFREGLVNYTGPVPYVDTFCIFDSVRGELLTTSGLYRLHNTGGQLINL